MPGCPIRTPPDQRPHASPRGFSQLAASFFACHRQGIRRAPVESGRLNRRPTTLAPHPPGKGNAGLSLYGAPTEKRGRLRFCCKMEVYLSPHAPMMV